MKVIFILTFIGLSLIANAGSLDCSEENNWPKSFDALKIEDCKAEALKIESQCKEGSISTKAQKLKAYAINNCLTRIMNKSLDVRLMDLKKTNSSQFKVEMNLQKYFNESIKESCLEFNNCEGTMFAVTQLSCIANLLVWRTLQADLINQKKLDFEIVSNKNKINIKSKNLTLFFSEMCKLPTEVFNNKIIPDDCEKKLNSLYISIMGEDCHAEN